MVRKFTLVFAALALANLMSAQTIDTIHTVDESCYNGFISEQIPGKQAMVYAENAMIVFKSKYVLNQRQDYYDFNRLSDSSKEIVRNHRLDTANLCLTSFEYNGVYYENMHIETTKDSTIHAYALTPRTYTLQWKDLRRTSKISKNSEPYGLRDVVLLKNGERLVGQILEQEISKSLEFDHGGKTRSINMLDIMSITSEAINDKYTIWEQAILLDRIMTSEDKNPIEGIITRRILGDKLEMMLKGTNNIRMVPMKNVQKYQKTRNPEYRPYVLDTAKVVKINDDDVVMLALEGQNGVYSRKDTLEFAYKRNTTLKLSLKNVGHSSEVSLYEYLPAQEKSKLDNLLKITKDETPLVIKEDAQPIYSAALVEEDGFMVANLKVMKPGKYFLSIKGFDAGVNLVIVADSVDKTDDKKKE